MSKPLHAWEYTRGSAGEKPSGEGWEPCSTLEVAGQTHTFWRRLARR